MKRFEVMLIFPSKTAKNFIKFASLGIIVILNLLKSQYFKTFVECLQNHIFYYTSSQRFFNLLEKINIEILIKIIFTKSLLKKHEQQ